MSEFNAEDFDVQPGSETDAYNTPEYMVYAATLDAERDFDNDVSMRDGISSLVTAQLRSGCVFSLAEVQAYQTAYNGYMARRMGKAVGL